MKRTRIIVHSFMLSGIILFSILAGYAVYNISGHSNQRAVQVTVAGALCVVLFLIWIIVSSKVFKGRLELRGFNEYLWVFGAALIWSPVIFVPMHFLTQDYLTSFGNILAEWLFQIPVSSVTLFVAWRWMHPHQRSPIVP